MELESIVANTVYIKAKESGAGKDKGKSKRWKEILQLPHISKCMYIEDDIKKSFDFIILNQPIGKELFWLYLGSNKDTKLLISFIDKVKEFELAKDNDKPNVAKDILVEILLKEENECLSLVINDSVIDKILNKIQRDTRVLPKELFTEAVDKVFTHLKSKPFQNFLDSHYFLRYLQWKYLELQPVTKDTFRMYRVLGRGGFGEVCACQVRATGKMYACKKLEKKRVKKRNGQEMALAEKNILHKINSRFIVALAYTFEMKEFLCLVLTIMNGGDLKFHIVNLQSGGFPLNRTRFYSAEIVLGLQHLHNLKIVYRDLKPENILIDDEGHLRISDLGLAIEIGEDNKVKGRVGTVGYMAPEIIKNERYGFSVDWFGYGCIVYEMITGESPFRKRKDKAKREEIEQRVLTEKEVYSNEFPESAKAFCQRLLQKEPKSRLGSTADGAKSIINHPFFKEIKWKRMEAGIEEAPFVPDPSSVYAQDVLDIEQFSSVKGVVLDEKDQQFFQKFSTGACSIPWQNEIIETECFAELNVMFKNDGDIADDLNSQIIPESPKASCCTCCTTVGPSSFYST